MDQRRDNAIGKDVARLEVGVFHPTRVCAQSSRVSCRAPMATGSGTIAVPVERNEHCQTGFETQPYRAPYGPVTDCSLYSSSSFLIPCLETFASVISSGIQSGLSSGDVSSQAHPS